MGVVSNIDLVVDDNKVIGFWIGNNTKRDNNTKPPDFNVIVGACEAKGSK